MHFTTPLLSKALILKHGPGLEFTFFFLRHIRKEFAVLFPFYLMSLPLIVLTPSALGLYYFFMATSGPTFLVQLPVSFCFSTCLLNCSCLLFPFPSHLP